MRDLALMVVVAALLSNCGPRSDDPEATLEAPDAQAAGEAIVTENLQEAPPPEAPSQVELEALALRQPPSAPPTPVPEVPTPEAVPAQPPPGTPAVVEATPSFLRGREFLLSDRTRPSYPAPKDVRIGPLWNDVPVRTQDPEVGKLFRNFLTALSRGEVRASLVAPAWLQAVRPPLQEVINQGWPGTASWRLGDLVWETDTRVYAPFIFRRGKNWAAGLLYAEPVRGVYRVTDVVADLAELKRDRQDEETPFEPDSFPILSPLP